MDLFKSLHDCRTGLRKKSGQIARADAYFLCNPFACELRLIEIMVHHVNSTGTNKVLMALIEVLHAEREKTPQALAAKNEINRRTYPQHLVRQLP